MEKLRKALDRARAERDGAPAFARVVRGEHEAAAGTEADSAPHGYTRTRVFTPDPALLERNRVLSAGSVTPAAEAFRMLRTQVVQRMGEHGWRTLAICSAGHRDGRTLAAVNLAITLAADPRYSVLLCDLDLRSPGVAPLFGLSPQAGVDDVIMGRATVADCLVHPEGFDRLVILPAKAPLARSSELLASNSMKQFVAELRERYPDRILIFDLPPVLLADDAIAFAPCIESALVVVGEGTTRRDDVSRCLEMLRNTPVVGTVLNRSLARKVSAA